MVIPNIVGFTLIFVIFRNRVELVDGDSPRFVYPKQTDEVCDKKSSEIFENSSEIFENQKNPKCSITIHHIPNHVYFKQHPYVRKKKNQLFNWIFWKNN